LTGTIIDKFGWNYVILGWMGISIIGVICIILSKKNNIIKNVRSVQYEEF